MFKDGIIKRIDLADMSMEIVPLGMSARIQFFSKYFDEYDAGCIGYVVMQTIVSCNYYHNEEIVKSIVEYYQKNRQEIGRFFIKNR